MPLSIDAIADARVLVVGDLMLDIYLICDVELISPEAPVPVVRLSSERVVPGGAANVAANLGALGAEVRIVGLTGADDHARRLAAALATYGRIDLAGILQAQERSTTTKMRVVAQNQQIVRIDRDDTGPPGDAREAELIRRAVTAIVASDAVILSDYGKGVLSDAVLRDVIAAANAKGVVTIVDPKRGDWSAYAGATVVTPNHAELAQATLLPCETDEEVVAAARAAQAVCGTDILVTRSEKGMSFVPRTGEPIHLATVAREVFDVSGAGDTVVAVLGATLAAGMPMVDAMRTANHAAGVVVRKFGTAVVTLQELSAEIGAVAERSDFRDGRLLTIDELLAQRVRWRQDGLTVGLANGCFDLVHPGHVSLIRQAASACDRLVIALNTDASVRRLKGPERPVQQQEARAEVMGAIKDVAAVVLFDEDTPYDLISALLPDVLVKGADYTDDRVVGADMVLEHGGAVLLAKLSEGQSTSNLINR